MASEYRSDIYSAIPPCVNRKRKSLQSVYIFLSYYMDGLSHRVNTGNVSNNCVTRIE